MEKKFRLWAWLIGIGCSAVVFLFGTFATVGYVDARHDTGMNKMHVIQVDVRENRRMLFDLSKKYGLIPARAARPKKIRRDYGIPKKER